METIYWILVFGALMSILALSGALLLLLPPSALDRMILPLIAFAAGSLIGGAVFHMIPHAVDRMGNATPLYVWLAAGFSVFLGLEQFLNWHHSHTHAHTCGPLSGPHEHAPCPSSSPLRVSRTHASGLDCGVVGCGGGMDGAAAAAGSGAAGSTATTGSRRSEISSSSSPDEEAVISTAAKNYGDGSDSLGGGDSSVIHDNPANNHVDPAGTGSPVQKQGLGYLILIADAVHNLLGGMFVGAAFVDSTSLGVTAWTVAAFHEIPQELGDFAVLVHAGWSKSGALLFNFLSSLTFVLGAIIAYASSESIDISFLIPFAAGNFLYIGATDLIPEVKHYHGIKNNLLHYSAFLLGLGVLLSIRIAVEGW